MRTQDRGRGRRGGACLPSLDEIAGGLYVDITKINWILVISRKCDTVMWSLESRSVSQPTLRLDADAGALLIV